jgi:UDP-N-acetylmuramoyl-tripeptide--D-alanyl-D-alanine ligase
VIAGDSAAYGIRRLTEAGLNPENGFAFDTQKEAAEFLCKKLRTGDLACIKGRTTDHSTRIFFAQVGNVACWKEYCPKRMLCDICWELGVTAEEARKAVRAQPADDPPAASVP